MINGISTSDRKAFDDTMQGYFESEKALLHSHVIHYLKTEGQKTTPAMLPTSLRFQTLEYQVPGADARSRKEWNDEGNNNVLVYLQMTNWRSMPDSFLEPDVSRAACSRALRDQDSSGS